MSKFDYTTDAAGNIRSWRQELSGSAAKEYAFGYDRADQLTSAVVESTDPTPVTLKRYGYSFDKAGNRTTEQVDDAAVSFTYDAMNRLTSKQAGGQLDFKGRLDEPAAATVASAPAAVTPVGSGPGQSFEGKAAVGPGTTQVQVQATDPAGNQRTNTYEVTQSATGASYTYDANGNLTSDGTQTYEWDAENRLVAVKQGLTTLASFSYDAWGRRKQKVAGGVTHTYVLVDDHVAEERLSGSQTGTLRYYHGPGVDDWLGRKEADGSSIYGVSDHLGSISHVTDASGTILLTREYDPWGNLLQGAAGDGPAFTGREWDPEIGLYYYRARYYSPGVGRFVSEDPAGRSDGPHLYLYVRANPTGNVDPYGLRTLGFGGKICSDCNCKDTSDILVLPEDDPKVLSPAPAPGRCADADAVYGRGGVLKIADFVTCHIVCDAAGNVTRIACGLPPVQNFPCGGTLPGGWPPNPLCR